MKFKFIALIVIIFISFLEGNVCAKNLDYSDYNYILGKSISSNGKVDYTGIIKEREVLDRFIVYIGEVKKDLFNQYSEEEKIAFYINAYNATTLKIIIDNYPIEAKGINSLRYPKNSIRQIKGVWSKLKFKLLGEMVTLDQIEHGILRKDFNEPRIHMALVCASIGCPKLRNEVYTKEKLESQLNNQSINFLMNKDKFYIDTKKKEIYISPIFKWFSKDFVKVYKENNLFGNYSKKNKAMLSFIYKYIDKDLKKNITGGKFKIKYLKYDWSLNE